MAYRFELLDLWAEKYGSFIKLGRAAEINHGHLSRIATGQVRLTPAVAFRLSLVTKPTVREWLVSFANHEADNTVERLGWYFVDPAHLTKTRGRRKIDTSSRANSAQAGEGVPESSPQTGAI